MFLDLKNILIAGAAGVVLGAVTSGFITYRYQEAAWTAQVAIQKEWAANMLQAETEKVVTTERKNIELNNTIEVTHATAKETIARTLADNRSLAQQLGGLRDPGRRQSSSCPKVGNSPAAHPDDAASQGRLSREASEFLVNFAADADRAAEYALTCRAWAQSVTALHNETKKEVSP